MTSGSRRWVWLDAVGGGWGGESVVGWLDEDDVSLTYDATNRLVVRHTAAGAEVVGEDIFTVLSRELADGPADARWFGYLGYGARSDLPARPDPALPDAVWLRPSHLRSIPHGPLPGHGAPSEVRVVAPGYRETFARVREHLYAGDSYEVNLTFRIPVASDQDPMTAYRRLRELNPAPYAGFLAHDMPGARAWLLSSSPEQYASIDADHVIQTRPIKGTTPRGATPEEDRILRARLGTEDRYLAENLMIVDLLRNDIGSVCVPGSVVVPSLMSVETYPSVHQLVSTVRGRLRPGISSVDALRALFPAGSMTGAPKLRTMEIIDAVEATPRGVYSGAFGYVAGSGMAELGVVIRSMTTAGDGRWSIGTGGGITVQSDVESELAEAGWKAARVLSALSNDRG